MTTTHHEHEPDYTRWTQLPAMVPERIVWSHATGVEVVRYAGRDTWDIYGPDGDTLITSGITSLTAALCRAEIHAAHMPEIAQEDDDVA